VQREHAQAVMDYNRLRAKHFAKKTSNFPSKPTIHQTNHSALHFTFNPIYVIKKAWPQA